MLKAWLRGLNGTDPRLCGAVRDALGAELQVADDAPLGIVVGDRPDAATLRQIRALAARARMMYLSGPDLRLDADQKWRLLSAGAADILDWPHDGRLAARIIPRMTRWAEIETLLASDQVRGRLVGESPAWQQVLREAVEIAAFSQGRILLTGETGTGKEQIAGVVHALDRRPRKAELVVVDCTTLSRELMGSELFGHEKGAFTGAINGRDGAIALAHRGTLFLDEIGELEPSLQAQLLRVIQERNFKRVGSNVWQTADFRLICATNRDLDAEVTKGRFRADLYYRISDHIVHLPPLRERREDIPMLLQHFWRSADPPGFMPTLDPALLDFLARRDYPGNVRDLRRIVMALQSRHAGGDMVSIGALPEYERPIPILGDHEHTEGGSVQAIPPPASGDPLEHPGFLDAIRQSLAHGAGLKDIGRAATSVAIRIAVEQEGGNLRRAAERLGITDRALQMRRANGEAFSAPV